MTARPQDHKAPAKDALGTALRLQGANMAQKATLDLVGGKLIMIVGILQRRERSDRKRSTDVNRESIEQIAEVSRMTRSQVSERMANGLFQYPDVEIQAVLNKAAEDIANLLFPKADG